MATDDNSFDIINNLGSYEFIAGSDQTFIFNVFDQDGAAVDLTGSTNTCSLSPYGQSEIVSLEKSGTITGTNQFKIELAASDTTDFSGKYALQPRSVSFVGRIYLPGQAILTIINEIKNP